MLDAQVLLPPFDTARVTSALRRLRIAPLLDGVRGEVPLDVEAFCRAVDAVVYREAYAPHSEKEGA